MQVFQLYLVDQASQQVVGTIFSNVRMIGRLSLLKQYYRFYICGFNVINVMQFDPMTHPSISGVMDRAADFGPGNPGSNLGGSSM